MADAADSGSVFWEFVPIAIGTLPVQKGTVVYKVLHACLKHKRHPFDSGLFHKKNEV